MAFPLNFDLSKYHRTYIIIIFIFILPTAKNSVIFFTEFHRLIQNMTPVLRDHETPLSTL